MTAEQVDLIFQNHENFLAIQKEKNALIIDLNKKNFSLYKIPKLYLENYVSGIALGLRLYYVFSHKNEDKNEDEPIIFTFSELLNTDLPFTNQTTITFKSPQNNMIMHNFLSGEIGRKFLEIKINAVIITGKSDKPLDITISREYVKFYKSKISYPVNTNEIIKNYGTDVIVSGSKAPFSSCFYNHELSGRGSLGLVFYNKNLGLIKFNIHKINFEKNEISKDLTDKLDKNKDYKNYLKAGTSVFLKDALIRGWAPISNFKFRYDPRLLYLSAEEIIRKFDTIKNPFPDFTALLMLGSNLEIFNLNTIIESYKKCLEYAVDPVSTGINDNSIITKYKINNLECGPFDYRGANEQGILNAFGFFIPLYRSLLNKKKFKYSSLPVLLHEYAFEMGLQCLGIDNKINAFISNKKDILPALSIFTNKQIYSNQIVHLGKRYIYLFYQTEILEKKTRTYIPDYFTLYSKSNHKEPSVFKANTLIPEFKELLNNIWRNNYGN